MRASDLYERITRHIVSSVEAGAAEFKMPWHRWGEAAGSPTNAITGRPYGGINVVLLWAAAELDGRSSGKWATYRQWAAAGAQLRKGEKATAILFWKSTSGQECNDEGDEDRASGPRFVARTFHVFNADQVDGFEQPRAADGLTTDERIAAAEAFFTRSGAVVDYGGDRAFYMPTKDKICMPRFEQFREAGAFYSVLGHEHIHWTGAEHRLNRDLQGRFGSDSYAFEELVAELGSAFLCGHLGLSVEPRADHASYVSSWLRVLRSDARAILTASSKAQEAADYLLALAGKRVGGAPAAQQKRDLAKSLAA